MELRFSNDANGVSSTVNYETLFSCTVLLLLTERYTLFPFTTGELTSRYAASVGA